MSTTTVQVETPEQARALQMLNSRSEALLQACNAVAERALKTRTAVEQGFHVNELGELQRTGDDMERACATRQQAVDFCKVLHCGAENIELASKGGNVWFAAEMEA